MELPPWSPSLAVVLATVLLFLTTVFRRGGRCRAYNLPPGPKPWPVIGNLNLIGPLLHRSVHELSARYGPLMSLRLGSFPVVVGSSVDMARFFLKTHDLAFIDRPKTASGEHIFYNRTDMLWAPYGAYWRQARRVWQTELLSARRLRSYEHIRSEEVRALLRGLHDRSSAGRAVTLGDHLSMLGLSVISRMVLGKKCVGVVGAEPGWDKARKGGRCNGAGTRVRETHAVLSGGVGELRRMGRRHSDAAADGTRRGRAAEERHRRWCRRRGSGSVAGGLEAVASRERRRRHRCCVRLRRKKGGMGAGPRAGRKEEEAGSGSWARWAKKGKGKWPRG